MDASGDTEIRSLVAHITASFREVLRGEGVSLHETKVLDDYGGEEARREARSWDTEDHWWEVPEEDLRAMGPYLCFLDGPGLRYYLPAYMVHSLAIFYAPHGDYTDTRSDTLDVLTHSDRPDLAEWQMKKWEFLTAEQGHSVCLYLRYVAAHDTDRYRVREAKKGLRQHWGRFCEETSPGHERGPESRLTPGD